jgi:raffinose/stachyose/melibiose transport system permease protein
LDKLIGASIIYAAIRLPFVIFIYVGFIKTIPRELDEAGIMEGCGNTKLFFYIIMPLLRPVTATCIVLTVQFVWNSFEVILFFIQSFHKYTLPLSIYTFAGKFTARWNLIFAGAILTVVPVVLLYIFCQKYIVSGMTTGAIKG